MGISDFFLYVLVDFLIGSILNMSQVMTVCVPYAVGDLMENEGGCHSPCYQNDQILSPLVNLPPPFFICCRESVGVLFSWVCLSSFPNCWTFCDWVLRKFGSITLTTTLQNEKLSVPCIDKLTWTFLLLLPKIMHLVLLIFRGNSFVLHKSFNMTVSLETVHISVFKLTSDKQTVAAFNQRKAHSSECLMNYKGHL